MHHQPPRMPQLPLTSPLRLGMVLGSPCAVLLEGVGGAPAFPAPPPRLFFLRFAPRLASVGLISTHEIHRQRSVHKQQGLWCNARL